MKLFIEKKIYFILFFLLILSYSRSPDIFNEGRFWGEDGSLYFKNALFNSFLDNFFKIYTPTIGYYNLFARITALVSSKFTLEMAPLVNIYLSYSILLYIFFLILLNNSYLYKNNIEKFLLCLLVLICPTLVPEIWLNSINTQCYLSIAALFILYLKDNFNLVFKYLNPIVLFIGGFSSVYVFFLTPFFFIKYKLLKNKYNLTNFLILLSSFIFQLIFYIYSKFTMQMIIRSNDGLLASYADPSQSLFKYMAQFFYNTLGKLFIPKEIWVYIYSFSVDAKILTIGIFFLSSLFLIYSVIETYKVLKNDNTQLFITLSLFLIFFLLISIISLFSGESFAGRYSSVPGFIVSLLIFNLTFQKIQSQIFKKYLVFLTLLILMSGLYQYRPQNDYRIQYLDCINDCIKWEDQIKKFNDDKKQNKLILWPYNNEDNLEKFEYNNILIIN